MKNTKGNEEEERTKFNLIELLKGGKE